MRGTRPARIVRLRRRTRWVLLALLAALLAPLSWLRTSVPLDRTARLDIVPVPFDPPRNWPAGLTLEGVWELADPHLYFGGYSALMLRGEGRALALSDRGETLAFTLPGRGLAEPIMAAISPHPRQGGALQDIESATSDPVTGRIWLGYEQVHAIRRFAPDRAGDSGGDQVAWPPQMRLWPENSGPEAMVRLADGRFVVLGERSGTGLLFAGDPVDGAPALEFSASYPGDYRPTDAAQLPDGRLLVLARGVVPGWPAFRSLLLVGELDDMGADRVWRPRLLARLDGALPSENYEALAVAPTAGGLVIWVMSDDNLGTFQRTLLARLRWRQ